ncbi:carbon-nitrogen hydrolase family protein [Helicobacter sp. MIT 00-7814]|uniref:carbon-nitrogen hydrolase family protein n=1 Tax=unclassified Helicobacter TaxID=2593540 RepID=UPI000E1F666B|nr:MULTISPECIES: carbon-nitrogen hydrolase family protein [unclassified Helicobacter]RDU51824.1 carbon-nitrogen hydrolase family protein [Helicobacter sp. MIT 99-10781]RDU51837.1 carbon-nitrogen hydrolase family protein [Helicobacter sp. MIT 00-7814]
MISKKLYSLQVKIGLDFEANLKKVCALLEQCQEDSIICTPEVVFSGFAYQKMAEAVEFSKIATESLLELSKSRTIITTMIEQKRNQYFNNLKVFHKGEVIHSQAKHKLFMLGEEHLHFSAGGLEDIVPFYVDSLKCAAINCFELRFIDLWKRAQGADIIFVPAIWGKARKDQFESLCKALAIINQAFVVASDGANDTMAKGSAIITPYGVVYKNDKKEIISAQVDLSEITKMRKYIQTDLKA